ncbi:hypothetical protein Tamer19_34000 [Cupriavidus sp. TA19]|uniref:DUF927 domain-containing protein n=1 Tax=Cupriavidus sp. TA19 TaxID=701108 RepID=UPI002729435B|nr:DUF927 domain-containing protein [Cupriavidus sp. TA19]GLC93992.1 hypothetical protein Tamer19_34000 [Cupriavidus sp. TA19]
MSEADSEGPFNSAAAGHTSAESSTPVVLTAQVLADAIARYCQREWAAFPLAPGKKTPATPHSFKDARCDLVHTLELFLTSVEARRVPGYFDALERRRKAGAGTAEHDAAEAEVMRLWGIARERAAEHGIAKAADPVAAFVRAIGRWLVPNLAIATGAPSGGACVLDIDEKDGKHGEATLSALEAQHGKVPDSHAITTASPGGRHLWLAGGDNPLRNSQGYIDAKGKAHGLGSGLDTKGTGGYAVAWPTVVNGRQYSPIPAGSPPSVPQWLHERPGAARMNGTAHPDVDNSDLSAGIGRDWSETPENIALVKAMLAVLPADDYMIWRNVGMAVKSLRWQCGEELFREWSKTSDKYDDAGYAQLWNSITPDGGISIGTLWHHAEEAGWTPPRHARDGHTDPDGALSSESQDVAGGKFVVNARGVWFIKKVVTDADDAEGGDEADEVKPVCSPLRILAHVRDTSSGNWGRLLEWHDADCVLHRWSLPMAMLEGDAVEAWRTLAAGGVQIRDRALLKRYLQAWKVEARARAVDHVGWYGKGYVLPDHVIGATDGDEQVVFQTEGAVHSHFGTKGTLDGWRAGVAQQARGNSRLVLAISDAFAAPGLRLLGMESFGRHFYGASSIGKTSALTCAASVYGPPERGKGLVSWRATDNGLEGVAAQHNDGVVVLDESGEIPGEVLGRVTYMLGNGAGKTRMDRGIAVRPSLKWTLLYLSSGEQSVEAMLRTAGKPLHAGQEVRLMSIPADAGHGLGVFETIHDAPDGKTFADQLRAGASEHHGVVGEAWLRSLATHQEDVVKIWPHFRKAFMEKYVPQTASAQVRRVAEKFAVSAFFGEVATRIGLTGWPKGSAMSAATACFKAWLADHGTGQQETGQILADVALFFQRFGSSRFEVLTANGTVEEFGPRVTDRAGFRRVSDEVTEYLMQPESFKAELCKHADPRDVVKVLGAAGWLHREPKSDSWQCREKLPGEKVRQRVYVIVPGPESEDNNWDY